MEKGKLKLSFNSPVILGFTAICLLALLLDTLTGGMTNQLVFSVYRSPLWNPLTYIRMVGHVFGHANWEHLLGNIMLILVIGPLLEEKYGSVNLIAVIFITAVITGIASLICFPGIQLLGASGVVFAFILLASFASVKEGTIPLTFVLVAVIYIGEQIYNGIFIADNVSNFTHILGGIVGAALGYVMNKSRRTY